MIPCYSAYAEQVSTSSALDKNTTAEVEVIQVTARKWQENIMQTPLSMTPLSQVEQMDLADIASVSGNLAFEQSSVQTRTVIRGLSSYDTSLTEPVAYYYNDIALSLGGSQLPRLANLQSIEVIKGPQGSLYGRNSQAGVINFQSQKPSSESTGFINLTYGQKDGATQQAPVKDISLYTSGNIIDSNLAGNLYLAYRDDGGAFYNQYLDDNKTAQREQKHINAQLAWQIQSNTLINMFALQESNDNGKGQLRYNTGLLATDRFVVNYDTPTYDNNDINLYGINVNHNFGDYMFTSITGVSNYQRDFEADLDLSPAPIPSTLFNLKDNTLSQEFRLTNTDYDKVQWLVGTYLYQQDSDTDFTIGGSQLLERKQRVTNIEQKSIAAFAQLDWQFSPNFWLTLGARAESLKQEGAQNLIGNTANSNYQQTLDTNEFLAKAALKYQINSNHLLFASFSQGYMPGGYNYNAAQDQDSFTYDNETSDNYELGYKGYFFENNLTLNASLFTAETDNKQIVDLLPGFVQTINNAAATTNKGVELVVDYRINADLSVAAHYAILDAKADEYQINTFNGTGFSTLDLSGKHLPLAAENTYGMTIEYWLVESLVFKVNAIGSSAYYFDISNTIEQSAYTKINAELSYTYNNLTLTLAADNITDEEILSRAVNTPAGIAVEDTSPRYVSINVKYDW